MKIGLPIGVKMIIDLLHMKGFEAYAVGGCVRDSILGREPDDWDITTQATPLEVKKLFDKTIDTGLLHGTVTVLIGKNAYEVTTYRIDGEYKDGRHPDNVEFTASLEEDLKRRDFTINAMAYSDESGLIDLYGGRDDLDKRIIRCVGSPMDRFGEDALRILRAVRFAAQLDYQIEDETYKAVLSLSKTLSKISAERIQTELTKLLLSDHPDYISLLYSLGITGIIMPEFDAMMKQEQNNPHHIKNVGEHTVLTLKYVEKDRALRYAALLHDVGKPACHTVDQDGIDHFYKHAVKGAEMTKDILRRLRMDNALIYEVSTLIKWHDYRPGERVVKVRKMLSQLGSDLFDKLLLLRRADIMAQSSYKREEKLSALEFMEKTKAEIIKSEDCISLKDLAITGGDLISLGMKPGPKIGEQLYKALDLVLEEPDKNTRGYLLHYLFSTSEK